MKAPEEQIHQRELAVVMFAVEATPFAKVGGLGDVVGALPGALAKAGARATIVIPGYRMIDARKHNIRRCRAIPGYDIQIGTVWEHAEIFHTRLQGPEVEVYLIGSHRYFDRDGVYDDPATKEGYPDNMERFVFFMKSGIELLRRLRLHADIIHCHDSHTALIPGILKVNHRNDPYFARMGTLLTIHNLAHQGIYPKESLMYAGIDPGYFHPGSPFEYWGQVNFMKAGIEFADRVNTVSRTYSAEIQRDYEFGMGLEGVLRNRGDDLSGIVNGINYEEWNPEKDPLIPFHFSKSDLSGKAKCKEQLLRSFGMPFTADRVPLIGIVSRLADQKGFDLIAGAIEELASLKLQMVILGMGQMRYHDLLSQLSQRYPEKFGVRLAYDNSLAHLIEAGCDLFLMPSKFEPCGLNQLYSLRYGTIPIVRAVGGLADTVFDYNNEAGEGTGFRFSGYTSQQLMSAVRRALTVYADPIRWRDLCVRAMSQDWSWEHSAIEYIKLYRRIRDMHHA
jgi:starch synthase